MKLRFVVTGVLTSLLNLALHGAVYFLVLRGFFARHPAGTEEFLAQLNKSGDQLVPWALAVSALALGFFITIVVRWSGASTLVSGLKAGLLFGSLYWAGINFGLYASSNNFSLPSTFADLVCSSLCMALSAGFAAWLLHVRPQPRAVASDEPVDAAPRGLGVAGR